jgi:ribose transport system substrate-binding protein
MKARLRRVVLAAAALAGFGTLFVYVGLASSAGTVRIAMFYYNPSPYGIATYKAAQVEAKKLGGVQITTFDGNNDPTLQTTQLTDAITTHKYKAFWVEALNGVAEAPTIKRAEKAGIKVAVSDYTLGDLNAQLTLKPTKGLVSTVGNSIGTQEQALVALIKAACKKQVGSGACNVAFMPGLANYPTDTLREQYMQTIFGSGNIHVTFMPPGQYDQATAQQVALTFFQAKPSVQVFASFGDQMTAGALTAFKQLGLTPGKDFQVLGLGATKELVADMKTGTVFGAIALYPSTTSYLGIKALVDSLHGKKVPTTINVIDKCHPTLIDAAVVKANKCFKPDWSLTGAPGGKLP